VIAYGDEGNDQLNGGSANEQMFGELGDDVIAGGGGQDLMDGGPGADQFMVDIHHLELEPSLIDGGTEQDQITIVGDSSLAQDLRVEIGDNTGTIASYSNAVQTGSVTFADMESIMLSGGGDQEPDQGRALDRR
jgi:Ca2+-binding RTX toxin-like protein